MGQSTLPKGVLGLGWHLVNELGAEDGNDTLRRWMAHHLAELIDKAEHGLTTADRLKARKRAMETILKVWNHRASLPGESYPLAPYRDVLKILSLLRPGNNPFRYFSPHLEKQRDQLAASIFDGLSRLIIALVLMKIPSVDRPRGTGVAAVKALSRTEKRVLKTLQEWSELFPSTAKSSGRTQKIKRAHGTTRVNLNEVALQLIDEMTTTLHELRGAL